MSGISRRSFVRGSAVVAAGAFAGLRYPAALAAMMGGGGMGGGGMGGGGMGGGVIDPPIGSAYRDPAELRSYSTIAGLVEVDVEARAALVNVNGVQAQLLTYNGQFPAPTIRARTSDVLRVHFKNSLPNDGDVNFLGHDTRITNLHTHGLHVTPSQNVDHPGDPRFTPGSYGDYMLVTTGPGGSILYEYDLSKHYPGTLNFYHPHVHGTVTDQMWAGMAGALVVEDPPEVTSLAGYETHIMMLKDITLSGGVPVPHTSYMQYMHGLEGSTVMVNGQVNPRLTIKPGQVQRWRICNSCTARFFRLSLSGHTMYLVGTEGGLLDKPYPVTELLVSPGERVDVLIKGSAKGTGSYKFLSLPYSRMGMMTSAQITLLTMTYSGSKVAGSLPSVVDPMAMRMSADMAMAAKTLTLSMDMTAGYINGVTFKSHMECYTAMSMVGGMEVWDVRNTTNMDHPFHHHTNRAQVLSITGGDAKYAQLYTTIPAWKDVTIVPKGGSIRLLMPVMDYDGMAMFHCHIIDHEDIGMMGMWHLM